MKKSFFIMVFLFLAFSVFCESKNEKKIITEDLEYFQEILENGYIVYNEVNRQNPIKMDLKKMIKSYQKENNWRKKQGFVDTFENGINQEALAVPLWNFLKSLNVEDGHLSVKTKENTWYVYGLNSCRNSEYYFSKKGEDYILIESPDKNLIGKKYTGNEDNLKKIIMNNMEVYVFAVMTSNDDKTAKLMIDDVEYEISIQKFIRTFSDKSIAKLEETEKTIYLRFYDFDYYKNSEQANEFFSKLDEIAEKVQTKNYTIIDLRGNHGGYLLYVSNLLLAMYEKNDDQNRKKLFDFLDFSIFGNYSLQSSVIAKNKYEHALVENFPKEKILDYKFEYEEELRKNKKSYIGLDKLPLSSLPQYTEYGNVKLNSKIIVLMDNLTSSAAEELIGFLYMMDKDNIILIGENTAGATVYGGILIYELPNSKIKIRLASQSSLNTASHKFINSWKGETRGFYPDYWTPNGHASETVGYLTGDLEMEKILAGLEN